MPTGCTSSSTIEEIDHARDPRQARSEAVPPPGAVLLEDVLPAVKRTKIGEMLGISRQQLNGILSERKPISSGIAVRIGKLFGTGPGLWLRMQSSYDVWHAERDIDTSKIPTIKAA